MINLPNIPQGIFGPDMSELSYGCKGPAVALLQQVLNFHMPFTPPPLAVDGIFGPKTKARTREFQELGEVAIDGIVGPQTARKICSYVESRFHLLVVPRRVAKKPVANDAAEARRQRPGRVASQPGDARFGTGTIGVMGLPQRSPFPQSAEQVVQLAPISQLIKQDRKDRNRRLMLNFKNHLRLGAGAFGGANLSYSFKTRAMEPTAFLATDLTLAMGLGFKEKFAAEIGGGFAYQLSAGFVDEHEWFAIAYSKLVIKLMETEYFELPLEFQGRLEFPLREEKPPTGSAAACLGPRAKYDRGRFGAALGFNVCLNYSVTREQEGGEKTWVHKLGPILGPFAEIRF